MLSSQFHVIDTYASMMMGDESLSLSFKLIDKIAFTMHVKGTYRMPPVVIVPPLLVTAFEYATIDELPDEF